MAATPWRFYVYEVLDDSGRTIYVGKGTGSRKLVSRRRVGGAEAREVARFRKESDAYSFERLKIAECSPQENRHPGGNGSRVHKRSAVRRQKWEREIERIGSRAYAARLFLSFYRQVPGYECDASRVDAIRRIAYG